MEAAAEPTTTLAEVAPLRLPLAKLIVIVSATLYDRLAKLATPLLAVALVVPCNELVPALRVATTTVLLSALTKLPKASSIRSAGCGAKAAPAVAVPAGGVCIVNRLAAAGLTAIVPDVALARLALLN